MNLYTKENENTLKQFDRFVEAIVYQPIKSVVYRWSSSKMETNCILLL